MKFSINYLILKLARTVKNRITNNSQAHRKKIQHMDYQEVVYLCPLMHGRALKIHAVTFDIELKQ